MCWNESDVAIRIGNGINNTTSISNTIKIIANKKNRVEKGKRAWLFGSNPHSNGDILLRSKFIRWKSRRDRENTRIGIMADTIKITVIISINQK